jgi:NADPH2:quinone reductase
LLSTRTLFDAIGKGWVRPDVRHRYALADAKEAHRALEARETSGSIILVP